MGDDNRDFLNRLLATFAIEAEEHLKTIASGLNELEKMPSPEKRMGIIETVFREVHSLKGAARAVNALDIESVCQSLESECASLKSGQKSLSSHLIDSFQQSIDELHTLISSLIRHRTSRRTGPSEEESARASRASTGSLSRPPKEEVSDTRGMQASDKSALPNAVRVLTAKLDLLLYQAEELLFTKVTAKQRITELQELRDAISEWKRGSAKINSDMRTLRQKPVPSGGADREHNEQWSKTSDVGAVQRFLEWNAGYIASLERKLVAVIASAENDYRASGKMVDDLLEDMKQVLMLPFSSLLEIFPKIVRDLARDRGKEVDLDIQGGEIEVDKRILEEMKDPLVHLIRNCIDHGIEHTHVRQQQGKSPRGKVRIVVTQKNGSKVEIVIADDGAGVDIARVRDAAVKSGIISPEEARKLSSQEALSLMYRSGVSTSQIITDISGRGLGLAIVQEKVEKLGGVIVLETAPNVGTTFRITVPLTVVTFRGILVRLHDQLFALPTINVERVAKIERKDIKTVENKETIQLDNQAISLVWLSDILALQRRTEKGNDEEWIRVLILAGTINRIAFAVDEILNEQEVLVKNLGLQLPRVRNIAGATVLGSGKVVPILNVSDLLQSAVSASPVSEQVPANPEADAKRKSILVAEDSITARTLLKNILESAGYNVRTTVDGVDAFTALRTEEYDLVVSDVDMPRMNGFDLTAKIRREEKLKELPVVLVTALESREDRERGIDAGANAYIVKSSFDQSNLLEAIRRLV